MKIIISPAKSLNYQITPQTKNHTQPQFLEDSKLLVKELKKFSQQEISDLMKISAKLAELNFERYQKFSTPFNEKNSKPAIFVFNGDVYEAIDVLNYGAQEIDYLQKNLKILSGLYGILRPLDLMQPYRLEMSTNLQNLRGKNLYQFWQEKITNYFNQEEGDLIVNLASEEYFSVIDQKKLKAKMLNVIFKERKDGLYKIIGIMAKRARGEMVDFMARNQVRSAEGIKNFDRGGYCFSKEMSDGGNLVFVR